ncbi:cyclin-dependent kinase inhibitor 4-like [Rutidosis leptorrhynchoides]|uniref:cyclin-dependent kinase inhibitor 4-like n=1 Tax=Rutidosis leptorrhynchoides TaxID=125765 RepID=UPI003A995FC7
MGKYMLRNLNSNGDVSLLDTSSYGGVRTRAKTLALRKASGSYIQLRNRRLVKPTTTIRQKDKLCDVKSSKKSADVGSCVDSEKLDDVKESEIRVSEDLRIGGEDSIGENVLEIEYKGRSTRETTPCNLIRDPDTISTPGSSTKRTYSIDLNYRVQSSAPSLVPLTVEMDELFTEPEKQQQRLFVEKYNFDPVNDKPLPGRFEWVKMDGTKNVE